jgi:hypothetical protein
MKRTPLGLKQPSQWRVILSLAISAIVVILLSLPGPALAAPPDLTQDQTTGVNEGDFFYLGPTGMKGWMYWSSNLTDEARQILVTEVRTNTPSSGVMEYHDVILGTNGALFTNDARAAFCDAVNDAEASGNNGELYLTVFRPSIAATNPAVATNTLMLQLQELGTLSATTPYNCPKVDGVLSNFCEYVYTNGPWGDPQGVEASVWMMLASGEPKYVDWACNWVTNQPYAHRTDLSVYKDTGQSTWFSGYEAVTLGQYFLLTGDTNVLPALENTAHFIAQGQDNHGLWGHTMAWPYLNGGRLHGTLPGYGALNQAGLVALYGMALAKKAGISDPEIDAAVAKAADFYRQHLYIGALNYGFNAPVSGVTDSNGRMGIAAHLFRCLNDPEASKWFTMMTATYKWRDWGHTGNEFNHCWGPMAADIGGPDLAHFVHTERETQGPYYLVSLTMRRQPEGMFYSQGQEGRGTGRQGAHATGGYGVQLAANRSNIEMTGAGYNTNDYWLTAQEMADVAFAQRYEAAGDDMTLLSTTQLLATLDIFCPKVAYSAAAALQPRALTNAALVTTLTNIVVDAGALDRERIMAVAALGTNFNGLVKSTTDTWFYPAQGRVLNWGACNYAAKDVDSWTNILAAITQFDTQDGFDMLMVAELYSVAIDDMQLDLLDAAGSNLYWEAAETILHPDAGGWRWVRLQNVKNWDPQILARYADKILRSAELYKMPYDAPPILENNLIGEGMHSMMVRCTDYQPFLYDLQSSLIDGYGENWSCYSNYTYALVPERDRSKTPAQVKNVFNFILPTPTNPVVWFAGLISTNIDNTLTNPATRLADLRANMLVGDLDDLFHSICLEKIVAHTNNADPFIDITNSLGPVAAFPGSHWRLYAGAVELGVADTNDVSRWMAALSDAQTSSNDVLTAGILHVLAGKQATEALASASNLLTHANDAVAMGAVDVLGRVGTKDELLMLFESYLTNSTIRSTSENGLTTSLANKGDYWCYAHWAAITNIVGRDYAGCLTVADQLAASFNTYSADFTFNINVGDTAIPYTTYPRTDPGSVLHPTTSQRPVLGGHGDPIGIYAVLSLFADDNANCEDALRQTVAKAPNAQFYAHGHRYYAAEASLRRFTDAEIIAIENAGGTNLWNRKSVVYYLLHRITMERMSAADQLGAFNLFCGEGGGDLYYYDWAWHENLSIRRGVEETEGMFFFGLK